MGRFGLPDGCPPEKKGGRYTGSVKQKGLHYVVSQRNAVTR